MNVVEKKPAPPNHPMLDPNHPMFHAIQPMLDPNHPMLHAIHPMLHIDVMLSGRRIGEELFDHRRRISVGRSRSNTIILPDEHAPRSLTLFRRSSTGYSLHYTDDTRGAVARSPGAPFDELSTMRGASTERHHGYDLALEEGARGRIDVGDETLEFEIVAGVAPLVVPRGWGATAALVAVALLGGVLAWGMWIGRSSTRPSLPMPLIAIPVVEPTPAPAVAVKLPEVTLTAPRPVAVSSRGADRQRGAIDLGGSLRTGGAFPVPKLDGVSTPPRGDELSADGSSDYTEDGVFQPEAVVKALRQDEGALRAIYERALRRSPAIEGDLVVRLLVNRDGSVGRVTVVTDTLPSVEVTRRVQGFLRGWHTPGPMAEPAEYELPLHFRPVKPQH